MNKYEIGITICVGLYILLHYIDHRLQMSRLNKKFTIIHERYWNVSEMNSQINPKYVSEE